MAPRLAEVLYYVMQSCPCSSPSSATPHQPVSVRAMTTSAPRTPGQLRRQLPPLRTPDGHGPRERHARYISNEYYDRLANECYDEAALDQQQRRLDKSQDSPRSTSCPKRQRQDQKERDEEIDTIEHDGSANQSVAVAESQLHAVLFDPADGAAAGTDTQSLSDDEAISGTETQSLSTVGGSPTAVRPACTIHLPPLGLASSCSRESPVGHCSATAAHHSRHILFEDGSGRHVTLNKAIGGSCCEDSGGQPFADLVLAGKSLGSGDCVFLTTMSCDTSWVLARLKPGDGASGARVTIVAHSDACWSTDAKHHSQNIPGFDNCRLVFPYMPPCSQRIAESGLGLQHGKLVLVFREDYVRVVVSSANLTAGNWTQHTNVVWWQDFPAIQKAVRAPVKTHTIVACGCQCVYI